MKVKALRSGALRPEERRAMRRESHRLTGRIWRAWKAGMCRSCNDAGEVCPICGEAPCCHTTQGCARVSARRKICGCRGCMGVYRNI